MCLLPLLEKVNVRYVTKVGQPSEKRTFHCPRRRRIILHMNFLAVWNKSSKLRCDALAKQRMTEHANRQ